MSAAISRSEENQPIRTHRTDELFRNCVGAYSALIRPGREEMRQLETLALALYDRTSDEARRFAAAALSDSLRVPRGLMLRLACEPTHVSAALLLRSPALRTRDMLEIVRDGTLDHCRLLARRDDLSSTVQAVVAHILRHENGLLGKPVDGVRDQTGALLSRIAVEEKLREAMTAGGRPSATATTTAGTGESFAAAPSRHRRQLRDMALTGDVDLFATALADALRIEMSIARTIVAARGTHHLLFALRALSLSVAEAHLIVSAIRPTALRTAGTIRLFVERYQMLTAQAAEDQLADWRADGTRSRTILGPAPALVPEDDAWDTREEVVFDDLVAENDAIDRPIAKSA